MLTARQRRHERSTQRRVLIVDDNEDARRDLVSHLRTQGWEVDVARDVKTAIESALSFQPHDIRLVGVTHLSHQVFEQARVAGFDVVFARPIDIRQLERQLELP